MELMICQGRRYGLFRDLGDAEGPGGPRALGPPAHELAQAGGGPRVPRSRLPSRSLPPCLLFSGLCSSYTILWGLQISLCKIVVVQSLSRV